MEHFGPFEVGRVLDSVNGATVYDATREGDPKGQFVVKVFSPERLLADEQQEVKSELDPLFKDIGSSFTSRINLQKAAAEKSPYFAPILAAGRDERGAWYATQFYPRALSGILERFVALEKGDLFHVIQSITRAALFLKKTAGRSHGNLKASNVFIAGTGRPKNCQVVVSDPMPGDAKEGGRYELADLRGIGELLYQLVFRRKVDFSGWVVFPVESSKEWTQLFEKAAPDWLALSNKLLDPALSPATYSLEALDADLAKLKPKRSLAVTLVPAGGAVFILAVLALVWLIKPKATKLLVTTDPPGAEVIVESEDGAIKQTNQTSLDGKPLELKLQPGAYAIRTRYGELDPERLGITLKTGQQIRTNIALEYGRLIVLSEPANASFWYRTAISTNVERTPFTNNIVRPGSISLQLDLRGFVSAFVEGAVSSNRVTILTTNLVPPQPGEGIVEFTSQPPGVQILINGEPAARTSGDGVAVSIKRMEGRYRVVAQLAGWESKEMELMVRKDQTIRQDFYFDHGILNVEKSEPEHVQILLDGRAAGVSPATIFLPPGEHQITFTSEGFDTNQESILVADKGKYSRAPRLNPKSGYVDITSDPPGAEIRVTDQAGALVTNIVAQASRRLFLQKGTYQLSATYPGLDPVNVTNVAIRAGERTTIPAFGFAYGTISFTNAEATDAEARISRKSDGAGIVFGQVIAQKPDGVVDYAVEAPAGYESISFPLAVRRNIRTNVLVRLQKQKVPVLLASNLQRTKASFSYLDEAGREVAIGQGPEFKLPWSTNVVFIARQTNLVSVRRTNDVPRTGLREAIQFPFEFGTVITTNLTAGTHVFRQTQAGEVYHGTAPEPFYIQPGESMFNLMFSGFSLARTNHTILPFGSLVLVSPGKPPWRSKSTGMEFIWVSGLPGAAGGGGYVSKYEVAQQQYSLIMGENPSSTIGTNLPVNMVNNLNAEQFCSKLTHACQQQADLPPGPEKYTYTLPSHQQWQFFAAGTTTNGAILSDGARNFRRSTPEAVGSTGLGGNKFGLQDLLGNVAELCRTENSGYAFLGGSYTISIGRLSTVVDTNGVFRVAPFTEALPQIGFRVVLLPSAL